jgi:Putative Na+/H+ antiporter
MTIEIVATIIFALALVHTFAAKNFERLSHRYPAHAGLFHLLGEVEVVFGFWAMVLFASMSAMLGTKEAITYVETREYTEPLFVFVVMVVSASRPVLQFINQVVLALSRVLPIRRVVAQVWLCLALVPLLGSLLTEPAAMTIAALILAPVAFRQDVPERFKYLALGCLFVNISIGGTLTAFAAPPVLMVAQTWNWDNGFMASVFGWKAAVAVFINATAVVFAMHKYLHESENPEEVAPQPIPWAVTFVHLIFLVLIVLLSHHAILFVSLLLLFMGFVQAYERYQSPLILKEALLVGFFLAGLVVLGGLQQWWLQPIVSSLSPVALFWGGLGLTAVTDNAALTYLGSLIDGLSPAAQYMLMAGAVTGGGLTVIANAPNPAGVALLRQGFEDHSIGALELLAGAAVPTLIAATCFLML